MNKLRNKKTGEIKEYTHTMTSYHVPIKGGYEIFTPWYPEEWEDYKPTEPLIKDEKVRKVVRAWADAFGVTKVYVCGIGDGKEYIELYAQDNGVTDGRIRISIPTQDGAWIGKEYAITELCGEEEE